MWIYNSKDSPHGQWRINYEYLENGKLGIAGHYGTTEINNVDVSGKLISYLMAFDFTLPVGKIFNLGFQIWYSSSAAHGTGNQEFSATSPLYLNGTDGKPQAIYASGGFVDIK